MAFKITDECISCAACEPECPNEAIREEETIYVLIRLSAWIFVRWIAACPMRTM